jgi:ABC-type lipoprotein release transport system permease subunit
MESGSFLTADDRNGILMGKTLAEKLNLKAGDTINLSVNTSNGEVDEQPFVIRGVYNTESSGFDGSTIFMPIAKAQTITQAEKHASTIFVLLKDKEQTTNVANALQSPNLQVLTWMEMNELGVQAETLASSYMIILYLIVLGITATVIVNTLIMAVFERTREIGILMAIGMKSHRVMAMFLTESGLLAVGGILMGLVIGLATVYIFTIVGFRIGDIGYSTSFLIGNTIYPEFNLNDIVNLTILTFIITLLAGLYPAWMASRLEPVQALHGGK